MATGKVASRRWQVRAKYLVKCETESEAKKLASLAYLEATRIDHKYSRYRDDNIVFAINNARESQSMSTKKHLAY